MQTTPQNGLVMPTIRFVLGIFALILSLYFSIIFISDGTSGAGIIVPIVFCVIFEFCKTAFTTDLFYYYQTRQADKALFSGLLVVILFALSISGAVFYLNLNPERAEVAVNQSDSRTHTLQSQITAKKAQIAACNQSYLSKCVNPRTAELSAMESEYNALLGQSDKLIDAKASAEFYKTAAGYFGTDAKTLRFNFSIARAVLLDFLGLILISQYTAAKRIESHAIQDLQSHNALRNTQALPQDNSALVAEIEALKLQLATHPKP
jgi:hypothetical protein